MPGLVPPVNKMKPRIQGATKTQAFSDSQKLRRLGLKRFWISERAPIPKIYVYVTPAPSPTRREGELSNLGYCAKSPSLFMRSRKHWPDGEEYGEGSSSLGAQNRVDLGGDFGPHSFGRSCRHCKARQARCWWRCWFRANAGAWGQVRAQPFSMMSLKTVLSPVPMALPQVKLTYQSSCTTERRDG